MFDVVQCHAQMQIIDFFGNKLPIRIDPDLGNNLMTLDREDEDFKRCDQVIAMRTNDSWMVPSQSLEAAVTRSSRQIYIYGCFIFTSVVVATIGMVYCSL